MSSDRASRFVPSRFAVRGRVAGLVASLLLAACASAPPLSASAPELFDDAHFAPPAEPLSTAEVLQLSPEMQDYLTRVIEPVARAKGSRAALTDALYSRGKLQLEYESSMTRNAAQAFAARQGNCLSLVLMTGAFAKAMGLKVTYQDVVTDEMWSRSGGLYVVSGHVNLMLERRPLDNLSHYDRDEIYTIDFMPGEGRPTRARPLSEETLLAMYMNNRAAEAMVAGHLDDAYWRVREALRLDPRLQIAYNTLAVVYLRHGDAARAESVLGRALQSAPDNPRLLSNQVLALRALGRTEQEQAVASHLASVEPTPPFHWFVRGQAALRAGDYATARQLFLKEIARSPDYHEFHYALAVADYGLGRVEEARAELAIAMQDAVRRSDQDLYAAKLDKLRNLQRGESPPTVQ